MTIFCVAGSEGRPSGDQDNERDRDRDKERGEDGARPREHHKESRGRRLEPQPPHPATHILTNNYDMPILTESPQLSPSLSPELEPMDTSDPAESLPHKSVSEEADSTTNNVISIPDTDDNANGEIISEGLSLLDSMESSLPTSTHFITVSPLSKPSLDKKLVLGRMVQPPMSHPTPPSPEKKSRKVAIEQRRQRQKGEQQSNLSLFASAWTEVNSEALRTSQKRVFGEDPARSGGRRELRGGGVEHLLLQGVPHPPQRRQLLQLPHRQIQIPLHSLQQMQDPRRERTQQLPARLYLYE